MYLLEVTRPFDSRLDFAERTDQRKIARYQSIVDRFEMVGQGWKAKIIPLTVGIRGSYDERAWDEHLACLDIVPTERSRIMRKLVCTTLTALDVVFEARKSILQETHSPC
jgi:hypothetical protein